MSDEAGRHGAQTDEERAHAIHEQLKSIHAVDMAYEMMVNLVSFGYQKMGLTDETAELRDMGDARVAIELLRATLSVVEGEAGEAQTRDLRATLAQMQLSFARAVQLGGAPESRPAEKPGGAPAEPPAAEAGDVAASTEKAESAGAGESAAGKPAAKEPSNRKPAAKKSAAKKPVQKKRAPRKPGGASPDA